MVVSVFPWWFSSLDPIRCAFFKHIGEEITVISVVNKRTFVFHTSMVRFTVSYSYTLIDLRFLVGFSLQR